MANRRFFPSLGVDLVEIKKAESFYRRHAGKLDSFFNSKEISFMKRRSCERLAMLLAAKEAVFKWTGLPWMGPANFKNVRILPGKRKMSFRLTGALAVKDPAARSAQLSFFKNKHYVIAQCAGTF